ncbi:hypothetical protein [Photobacterium indicum]|uniref:Glycosyltransferase 2-like domain-containing protein n=1 Tax=Photobacterium indicum TaxID=81447 RepID=A0A2T3L7W7_9GAMM|nr:hypothetical protein [Photobacterium indicum]PSV46783.1 hypothetical protein C9J47_13405 [Photobacterium indicum]
MNNKVKTCAAVTLYHPSKEELERLKEYLLFFPIILVVDNTPEDTNLECFFNDERLKLISKGANIGLSKSLNLICETSSKLGYDYCCVLDQDSTLSLDAISEIHRLISINVISNAAIVSPTIVYEFKNSKIAKSNEEYRAVDWVITSGSFINIAIFINSNGFDENYFIDRIEYDYCMEARKNGFDIIQVSNAFLFQKLGSSEERFGIKFFQHSPLRNYYQFRNRFYYFNYKSDENFIVRYVSLLFLSIKQVLKILILETDKTKKLEFIVLAIRDCLFGKFGKFNES